MCSEWAGVLLHLGLVIATNCSFHVLVPWVCPLFGPTESLRKSGTNGETLKNSSCPFLLLQKALVINISL